MKTLDVAPEFAKKMLALKRDQLGPGVPDEALKALVRRDAHRTLLAVAIPITHAHAEIDRIKAQIDHAQPSCRESLEAELTAAKARLAGLIAKRQASTALLGQINHCIPPAPASSDRGPAVIVQGELK